MSNWSNFGTFYDYAWIILRSRWILPFFLERGVGGGGGVGGEQITPLTTHTHPAMSLAYINSMFDHTFSKLTNHQIRHQAIYKVTVSLVVAYGRFNLPQGFVWVSMG